MPSHSPASAELEARRLFLCHLDEIRDQLDLVARQARLSPQRREEFVAWAFLRMVEDEFKVVAEWRGESSLRSFLGVVVTRLLLDFRNERWGRWRVSKTARKAGLASQLLDVLMHRDGFAASEAVEMVLRNHPRAVRSQLADDAETGAGRSGADAAGWDGAETDDVRERLLAWAQELPHRQSRRMTSLDAFPYEPAGDPALANEPVARARRSERKRLSKRVERVLEEHCEELATDDRTMIRMWFRDHAEAAEIADVLGVPRRRVYHRITTVLGQLRRHFQAAGFEAREVLELVGREAAEIEISVLRQAA